MTDTNKHAKKLFVLFYRMQRSVEYADHYDHEKAWKHFTLRLKKKRIRRTVSCVISTAAVIALSFTVFHLWKVPEVIVRPETAINQPQTNQINRSAGVTLSLANGNRIDLSVADGQLSERSGIVNSISGRQLVYPANTPHSQTTEYNRLNIPRRAEYHLILSDGTRVWINSQSQLDYPVAFGKTREIYLQGEAYFEVAHDEKRPFVVRTNGAAIKVLGTEFNVNTHNTKGVQTVLVQGRVEIDSKGNQPIVLKPGELAEVNAGQVKIKAVNIRKYTAWRYGEFYFEEISLEEIMKELADWYDVQVVFTDPAMKRRTFGGVLKRSATIQEILQKIECTTSVHFTLHNKIVKIE